MSSSDISLSLVAHTFLFSDQNLSHSIVITRREAPYRPKGWNSNKFMKISVTMTWIMSMKYR